MVVNDNAKVVGGFCKHRDILIENKAIKVFKALETADLSSEEGQN